ncbi:MAG: hypothetical protein M3547_01010 [Acidobacteriota bacterium]|nr:hypothetical protein [Acidobacteriota bacterium]
MPCRSCGAVVIWAETEKGKRMPVDAKPSPTGNFKLREDGPFTRPDGTETDPGVPLAVWDPTLREERYDSHFKTCPDRDRWRK